VDFFLRRVFVWVVLVGACALPLAMMTWRHFTPTERFGEALGVFVWTVVMVIAGEQLRWPSREDIGSPRGALLVMIWNRWNSREADRRSKMLRAGALATAIVHAGLAIFAGPLGIFLWFAPAVLIASPLLRIWEPESDFLNALLWTVVCGAQSAIVAWLWGRAIDRTRRALSG
jgi:hypothetical protein